MSDGALPSGWAWASLRQLIHRIEAGKSFKCEERSPGPNEVGVVKVSAVTWGSYDEDESKTCKDPTRIDPGLFVREGDLLFSRANTIELVGACVIARGVRRRIMLSDKILRLRLDGVDQRWVLYMLRSKHGRNEIERLATGNQESMRNIGQERIRAIRIPLPPVPEQPRIVTEVEQQFSRVEDAVASLHRAKGKLTRYRASVLKAACEGRLVPTEAELARTEGAGADHEREDGFERRPDGWAWTTLGQLGEVATGTTPPTVDPTLYGGDLPFFKPTDLDAGYNVRFARQHLTKQGALAARPLPEGSVLVTCIGATIGKTGLARVRCATNQQINALVPDSTRCSSEWVFWVLTSPFGQKAITTNASATTLPILNKSRFALLPIPLPPRREQDRIVAEVERRLSIADEIAATIDTALARAERLRQSILKRAFEGKLVPQDPNDEPASMLLERIREEREAAQEAKRVEKTPRRTGTARKRRAARS